jgi:hypothetical protein
MRTKHSELPLRGLDNTGAADQPVVVVTPDRDPDPRKWTLDVDRDCIDLYLSILDEPRALTADEAKKMVDLVNAWRAAEQEKHITLMAALDQVRRLTEDEAG